MAIDIEADKALTMQCLAHFLILSFIRALHAFVSCTMLVLRQANFYSKTREIGVCRQFFHLYSFSVINIFSFIIICW